MRLFSAGTFYLSRSSSLAAEYLCDRDTISQHRNTGLLLSTVIQMHTMERDTQLYLPDISVYDTCEDVCDWLHASAHNVAWMIDYFEQLDAKCVRMFDMNPLTWDFKRKLRDYVDVLMLTLQTIGYHYRHHKLVMSISVKLDGINIVR